jgi:hypothetical protein
MGGALCASRLLLPGLKPSIRAENGSSHCKHKVGHSNRLFGRSGLAKKGRFYERNQYFLRSAYRPLHDLAAPQDAQAETTGRWVSITKDVPILRIDHGSIKGKLLGVWQAIYGGCVLDFKETNRRLAQASENFSFKEI